MARLIDMDELLNEFEALKNKAETLQDAIYLDAVMAVIDTAPTINAVPNDYICPVCGNRYRTGLNGIVERFGE